MCIGDHWIYPIVVEQKSDSVGVSFLVWLSLFKVKQPEITEPHTMVVHLFFWLRSLATFSGELKKNMRKSRNPFF